MSEIIAAPDVLFVPAQFRSIQEAVDAARQSSTVMVEPGYYDESVIIKDKECIVIQSTALSRRGVAITGAAGLDVFNIQSSTVHLSGIVIRSDGRLRGISARDSSLSLQECVVACNRASSHKSGGAFGGGMACCNSSVRIQKTAIVGNLVESDEAILKDALGGGIYFEACRVEIAGSTIQANSAHSAAAARGGGIWGHKTRLRMWRSRVTDNVLNAPVSEGGGIYFTDAGPCDLGGSVITGNGFPAGKGGGIFIEGDPAPVSIHRNTAVKLNHPDDVHLRGVEFGNSQTQ